MEKHDSGININEKMEILGCKDNLYRYIVNGMLIFFSVYGSIKCYISAFSVECYNVLLFLALLFISMLYAFMHISMKIRKISYGIIFFGYVIMIINLRVILKSGFSRLVNITYEFIENEFNLPVIQRYSEYYSNSRLSVTMCLIILGFVMSLILNIVISEYMSVIGVLIFTLPIAQLGMYFDLEVDYIAYFMFILTPLVVLGMKMSGRYCISDKSAEYRTYKKKEKRFIKCKTEPKVQYQIAVTFAAIIGFIMLLLTPLVMNMKIFNNNQIKKSTNVYVREVALSGLWGALFNKGGGGIGGGKLGDVGILRNDYQADLKVRYVPLPYHEVTYLKAFTGAIYDDNGWYELKEKYDEQLLEEVFYSYKYNNIASILEKDYNTSKRYQKIKQKMNITNVGANADYIYVPYYNNIDKKNDVIKNIYNTDVKNVQQSYDIEFYPLLEEYNGYQEKNMKNYNYKKLAYFYYMDIPNSCQEAVADVCNRINFKYKGKLGLKYADQYEEIEYKKKCSEKIRDYLSENYEYSLKCGKTPDTKDFVEYFLNDNKQGYCAHFATTAVMMFRYMGIPARYVEGYVIDSDNIKDGTVVDENIDDYIEADEQYLNTKHISKDDLKVRDVEVTDANAHAWVEIYFNDFGWVTVEATPVSGEEEQGSSGGGGFFASILSFFSSNGNSEKVDAVENVGVTKKIIEQSSKYKIILDILILAGEVLLIIWFLRLLVLRRKRKKSFESTDYRYSAICVFNYMCEVVSFCGLKKKEDATYNEYIYEITRKGYLSTQEAELIADIINKAGYSVQDMSLEQVDSMKTIINCLVNKMFSELSIVKKFIGKFIKNM